jgi:hypothetical protein
LAVARSRPGGRKIESQVNFEGGGTLGRLPEVRGCVRARVDQVGRSVRGEMG